MKYLNLILIFGFIVASSASVEAATAKKKKKATVTKSTKVSKAKKASKNKATAAVAVDKTRGNLKTNVSFDDTVLHGQYQMPEEGLAKVETEKVLSDILGVRQHFKDRLSEASQQE